MGLDRLETPSPRISVGELIYYLMFGLLFLSKAIGWYDGMPVFKAVLLASTALFACKLLVTRQTRRDWIFVIAVCLLAAASYYCARDKSLILYAFMMLGMKDVPVRRIMKYGTLVWTVGFIVMTALAAFGVISEKILVHPKHGLGFVICHTLGYSHPNVLHVSYVVFAALVLYLVDLTRSKRLLWITSFLVLVGNVIVFINSISFTGAAIIMFLLVINLYLQLRGSVSRVEFFLLQCILPVCVVFSLVGPLALYGTQVFDIINKAMNTRYNLSYYFLTEQPITLLGSQLTVPNYRYTMDCSYTFLLVQLGVIPFVLILLGILLLIRDAIREHRYAEVAVIISFCVGGVSEPFLFNTSFKNLTFVFLGEYLYRRLAAGAGEEGRSLVIVTIPERLQRVMEHVISCITRWMQALCAALEAHMITALSLFMAVMMILAGALFVINPWAASIYVPDAWHDNQTLETLQLSEDDVQAILADHGEIIGDASQYDEMVMVEADTLLVENVCKSVNAGAIVSTILSLVHLGYICSLKEQHKS